MASMLTHILKLSKSKPLSKLSLRFSNAYLSYSLASLYSADDPKECGMNKETIFFKVLHSAIDLDYRKGHLKWTMSDLARKSGIKRPLIYYYFGKEKADILREAVRLVGEVITKIEDWRDLKAEERQQSAGLKRARQISQQLPNLASFYLDRRSENSCIGEELRTLERRFLDRLKIKYGRLSDQDARIITAVYQGFLFSPLLESEDYNRSIDVLRSFIPTNLPC